MSDVQLTVNVPKELNDVRVALVQLIKDVRAGHSPAQIMGNLGLFLAAIDGIGKIPEEIKTELVQSLQLAGLFAADVMGALLTPQV